MICNCTFFNAETKTWPFELLLPVNINETKTGIVGTKGQYVDISKTRKEVPSVLS